MAIHWIVRASGPGGKNMPTVVHEELERMKSAGITPCSHTCMAALQCLAHAKPALPSSVDEVLTQYMDPANGGCGFTAEAFALLAKAYANGRGNEQDPQAAQATLARMETVGIAPTTANMNAVLEAHARANPPNVAEIEDLLASQEGAGAETSLSSKIDLDTTSYNWLIHALANAKPTALTARAAEVPKRMIDAKPNPVQPNVQTYTMLVNAYAKVGDYYEARNIVNQMLKADADAAGTPGLLDAAALPDAAVGALLNAAKNAAFQLGRGTDGEAVVQDALTVFEQRPLQSRNCFMYASLIAAMGQVGAREKAEVLFEEAARTFSSTPDWPNKFVYGAAYDAVGGQFSRQLAFRWVKEKKDAESKGFGKVTYGKTKLTFVKPKDTPWWPKKKARAVYSH